MKPADTCAASEFVAALQAKGYQDPASLRLLGQAVETLERLEPRDTAERVFLRVQDAPARVSTRKVRAPQQASLFHVDPLFAKR